MPALIAAAGEDAARHFINFFIASIRNRHTRRSYARQAELFLSWCQARGLRDVREVRTEHVAAYIELLSRSELEAASVKQALSALRMLFSWLVVHQVVPQNPTASVRGPKLVVSEGKTPYLPAEDVVRLIESIPTDTLVGLRDRALIGVMAYTFARIGAAVGMNVGDYYPEGKLWALRFREKGGKRKQIAAHTRDARCDRRRAPPRARGSKNQCSRPFDSMTNGAFRFSAYPLACSFASYGVVVFALRLEHA